MTRESQTRIVLDPKHKPKAEEIMAATGINTYSQLFSILLVCYGDHLVSALKSPSMQIPIAQADSDLPKVQPKSTQQTKQFAPLAGF
ncbi:hypothetical protein [Nostoc sp. PCC 7107]|uniref:hypothetical protein n=1 Tax=Nostoc sp. PCC 7107 TaxID=317936 RepID=UPI00029EFD85|nr:hypothetical protein [Nostoc sp. PCC 7107]AFY43652.1 hypothetical protein Nos7107_3061 [Nostoc sp. PCC 7107]